MTAYGTIPTEPSNARERIRSSLGTRRPWRQMIQVQSLSLPQTFHDYVPRIKRNFAFFYTNYSVILFLSFLWHPICLIVFIAMMTAWLYLYFLRDDPLVVFGVLFSDKFVLVLLFLATILGLYFTDVTNNIIVTLFIGLVLILGHGMLRVGAYFGSPISILPMKNAASSSF